MAPIKMNDFFIRSLKTEGAFLDSVVPGLQLRVRASMMKSWSVRYRTEGNQRRLTLGEYPNLSLAAARKAWLKEATGDAEEFARREQSDFLLDVNHEGEITDFYCLRHTCGISQKCYLRHMRHFPIMLPASTCVTS